MADATRIMAALAAAVVLAGCDRGTTPVAGSGSGAGAKPAGPAWFEEVAVERGIDFTWNSGHAGRHHMPESIGGGAALFDMDGDGDLDAYLVQAGDITASPDTYEPNRLYENTGGGRFRDVTEASGTGHRAYGMGVACGDVDNDGDVDLYVTNVGPNVLFRNDGGGKFTDVTDAAGVGHAGWGTSAAFLDYDLDGDLDLYVLNYINWSVEAEIDCFADTGVPDYCLPANYSAPARDILYRNEGGGRFVEANADAAMTAAVGTGLGVVAGDYDGNSWPDIFVANDGLPDQLWLNRGRDPSTGQVTFIEIGTSFGAALDQEGKAKAGMGVATADIDDDNDLDVIVCNLRQESDSVFINERRYFRDGTIITGLGAETRRFTRFGVGWLDFDHDGYLDLYEANGRVQVFSQNFSDDVYAEPNTLLRGLAGPKFVPFGPQGGTEAVLAHTSRAAAFGDVDDDGAVDVLVVNRDGPAYLLRNIAPNRGHWLMLRMLDPSGRDALGAAAFVEVGGRTLRRDCRAAYSYLASNDPRVHVGLGATTAVDRLTVRWPDGSLERFPPPPVDRLTEIRQGTGDPVR